MSAVPSLASTSITPGLEPWEKQDIFECPEWSGLLCTAGAWEDTTRGHGGTGSQDPPEVVLYGHEGHFGVLQANWGG